MARASILESEQVQGQAIPKMGNSQREQIRKMLEGNSERRCTAMAQAAAVRADFESHLPASVKKALCRENL